MPRPFSLFVSFSGGFFSGAMLCTHFFINNKQVNPLDLIYKKANSNLIEDLKKK